MSDPQMCLTFTPARVYWSLAPRDRPRVQRIATSVRARVMAFYRQHPEARKTAPELGKILGLRVENCLAPRMSELYTEGWLEKDEEPATPGDHSVLVHRYFVGPRFDGGERE